MENVSIYINYLLQHELLMNEYEQLWILVNIIGLIQIIDQYIPSSLIPMDQDRVVNSNLLIVHG